jgi:hypothetical protein
VFSTHTTLTGGWWCSAAATASATIAGSSVPSSSSTGSSWTLLLSAAAPFSYSTTCWRRPTSARVPGRPRSRSASWLAIVPDGTNSAAPLPTRAANRSSSRLTVGSSP